MSKGASLISALFLSEDDKSSTHFKSPQLHAKRIPDTPVLPLTPIRLSRSATALGDGPASPDAPASPDHMTLSDESPIGLVIHEEPAIIPTSPDKSCSVEYDNRVLAHPAQALLIQPIGASGTVTGELALSGCL